MKVLACELCGSNELVKKDGLYECAHCGTKYSTEEARRLLVSIDNTQKISNYLSAARKERLIENWHGATAHYDRLLAEDPNHWEALFFSSYCRNRTCTVSQIPSATAQMDKTTELTLRQIKNTLPLEEQASAVQTIASYIAQFGSLLFNSTISFYNASPIRNDAGLSAHLECIFHMLTHCAMLIQGLFANTPAASHMQLPAVAFLEMLDCQYLLHYPSANLQPLLNALQLHGSEYLTIWHEKKRKQRILTIAKMVIWFTLSFLCIISLILIPFALITLYFGFKNLRKFLKNK